MAVKLVKPIRREMLSREQNGKYRGKPVIVELLPGDEISFRPKGTKKSYTVFLGHCYRLALILTLESEYKQKLEAYTIAKKQGKRVRRPRRPGLPFNKIYFNAIKTLLLVVLVIGLSACGSTKKYRCPTYSSIDFVAPIEEQPVAGDSTTRHYPFVEQCVATLAIILVINAIDQQR